MGRFDSGLPSHRVTVFAHRITINTERVVASGTAGSLEESVMVVCVNAPHDFNMSDLDDTFGEFLAYTKCAFMVVMGRVIDELAWQWSPSDDLGVDDRWDCFSNTITIR